MRHAFRIVAAADPQALPRIVGFFAQRWLVPDCLSSHREGERLKVELEIDVEPALADIMAARLREMVLISDVDCMGSGGRASLRVRAA